jgi:CRISP-associated protein Cas1
MGWRTVFITNPCRLSVKERHLVIEPKDGECAKLPLVDISVIMIETPQCSLSSALLSIVADEGIALFACDSTHIPNGLFAPFASHSRHTKTAKAQSLWSEPFRKRCWQKIVKAKIQNQAKLLEIADKKDSVRRLINIAGKVTSGDSANCEAQAAAVYWRSLFDDFVRGGLCVRNSALNYGYAILRGVIGRSLCASGFIPAFGLHHENDLNAFNLADDIIEPFRPFVDALVWRRFGAETRTDELSKDDRAELVTLLGESCFVGIRHESILNAADIVAQSLANCSFTKESQSLILPTFAKL